MAGDINIVAIVKGEERYVFMFDEASRAETLRTLGRFASNPELSFSWYDAAVLSQKIRKTSFDKSPANGDDLPAPHFHKNQKNQRARTPNSFPGTWPNPDVDWSSFDDPWIEEDPAG